MLFGPLVRTRAFEYVLFVFLLYSVCLRGGKTIDATWVLIGISFVLLALEWWQSKKNHTQVCMPLWLAGMIFISWSAVSFFVSRTQNYGLDEVLRDGVLVLLFFYTARRVADDQKHDFIKKLSITIAFATLAACFVGIAVYIFQPVNRFVGTFFDARFAVDYWPNAWAEYLLLAWPVAVFSVRRSSKFTIILIAGFILGCLLLSYSRGAILAFAGQVTVLSFLYALQAVRGKYSARTIVKTVGVCVAITCIAIILFMGMNAVRSHFYTVESVAAKATFTAAEGNSSVSERKQFWKQSFELSLQKPLFGWGPYSFRFVQPRLQTGVFETSDHPHNVFLKLAMERGWPSAFLFLCIIVLVVFPFCIRCIKGDVSLAHSSDRTLLCIAMFVSVVGVIAHNMIDYNLQFVGIILPFWLFLGCLASTQTRECSYAKKSILRELEMIFMLAMLCVAVFEGRYLITSSLGRRAEANGNIREALFWYDRSIDGLFSRDLYLSMASLQRSEGRISDSIQSLEKYAEKNSEDARVWLLRGDIAYFDQKDYPLALTLYQRANAFGRFNYLNISTGMLRTLNAVQDVPVINEKKNEMDQIFLAYQRALLQNSHFIDLSQNVEEFDLYGSLLASLYPSDAPRYEKEAKEAIAHAHAVREQLGDTKQGLLW